MVIDVNILINTFSYLHVTGRGDVMKYHHQMKQVCRFS